MIPVALAEYLNQNNPWTARLLGQIEFSRTRDALQVEREYDADKYGELRKFQLATPEAYKQKEFELGGLGPDSDLCVSFGEAIFRTPLRVARPIFYGIVQAAVSQHGAHNVCELGCGYGFNLTYLGAGVLGGEFSRNAVALGRSLGLDVHHFDYYDPESYAFIPDDTTIVTVHSMEQIPDAGPVIDSLANHRSKIRAVVHLEPSLEQSRSSLLGIMRNRYIELNDYNRNLLRVLDSRDDVEILDRRLDLVGLNPLNSAHLIAWRFR